MGLLDKLRGELVDIVEWIDHTRDTLVWRFPRYHNQIKNGANLIVRPGQVAVFVHRGRLADTFEPGHYELTTDNLPILSTLQGWKHGFDSPFKSEVYFVSTRQVTDLKWGTPNPIMLRDADFGPIRLRAFGTYTLKATNPQALLKELVGTDESFEADEVNELMRSIINSAFADMVGGAQIAALDLAGNYQALADRLRKKVVERVDDEYGLDVPQLFIVNISLPEAVEKALDTRTGMNVIGDMERYQQYQMGQAMTAAAANPAGGGAAEGLGLGMGMAMAGRMMQRSDSSPPPSLGESQQRDAVRWHVAIQGKAQGPFDAHQIADLIRRGEVTAETPVWTGGMSSWIPAGTASPWSVYFQDHTPPPLPAVRP
jgi:membrane protease subunit (stomatin/prohibitin family)